jgi:hypothetical protein
MRRQCGRPGCSAPATATFTFDATRCVVWLNSLADGTARAGDLCTRHADSLTPPQSWERVDRRPPADPAPVAAASSPTPTPVAPRRRPADDLLPTKRKTRKRWSEVPSLFDEAATEPAVSEPGPGIDAAIATADEAAAPDPWSEPAWLPRFEPDDDLGGVLAAETPLLARAFGNVRPPEDGDDAAT